MKKKFFKKAMKSVAAFGLAVGMICSSLSGLSMIPTFKEEVKAYGTDYELLDHMQDSTILHCWNWSYKTIQDNLELIAQCGYSAVQTSPATQPKDYMYEGVVYNEVGWPKAFGQGSWWKMYQPVAEEVCDNGYTWLGDKEDLESLCEEAEKYGIKVIVDVVANHMANITGWQNSLDDVCPQIGEFWNADMLTNEKYWHINDYQVWMSDSRLHFTQGTMGMPDLNTADDEVQQMIADYLCELVDCGVDGFRFDAAKHIETPDDDPDYASDFWPTVLNAASSRYSQVNGGTLWIYGEILNRVGLEGETGIDAYYKYMSVTDNSAGDGFLSGVRNGNLGTPGYIYDLNKTVAWVESHDTYMNESSCYASDKSIARAWTLIAGQDTTAKLFFARPYTSDQVLVNNEDGNLKSVEQIKATATAQMGNCETYEWATDEVAAINHFNNRFYNCSSNIGTDGEANALYCQRGQGIAIASFNGAGSISMSSHGLADGTYTDEVSGNTFTVSGGRLSGTVGSEYGIAVIYKNVMPNPNHEYPVQIVNSKGNGSIFYSDGIEVTVNAKYATSASYVASTGETGTLNGETTFTIGKGLSKGQTVTLTITASNKKGTKTQSYTYTKEEYDLSNCIFYKNTNGWGGVTAYCWDSTKDGVKNAAWPGEAMFECDSANKIYAVAIDPDAGYDSIIFSNSGASQSDDLAIGNIGYMYDPSTGVWSQYKIVSKPSITSTLASSEVSGSTSVTFTVTNATSATYSVNGGTAKSFTGSVTLTVGNNSTDKIYIKASNTDGTSEATYTYTLKQQEELKVICSTSVSEMKVGESVTLSAKASGGSGSYTYSFLINNPAKNEWYRFNSSFTSSNTHTWKAGSDGRRNFYVEVKDSDGTVVRSEAAVVNVEAENEELTITGNASKTTVTKGDSVVITGTAAGGTGSYTYSYLIYSVEGKTWYRFNQTFKASNTHTWKATTTGNKKFYVEVKDSSGKVVRSSAISVKVNEGSTTPLSIKASSNGWLVAQGSNVTITGTATGGTGSYTYSYLIYSVEGKSWYRFNKTFTSNNILTWKASTTGNKKFYVEVKDSAGTVVRSSAVDVEVK